jgi:hypothetical protein
MHVIVSFLCLLWRTPDVLFMILLCVGYCSIIFFFIAVRIWHSKRNPKATSRVIIFSSCRRVYSIPMIEVQKRDVISIVECQFRFLDSTVLYSSLIIRMVFGGSIKCVDGWHPATSIIMIIIATIFLHCITSFFSKTELKELVVRRHMMLEERLALLS